MDQPRGIALDLEARRMYWTESVDFGKIRRAKLNGANVEDVCGAGFTLAAIALDLGAGKMYISDAATDLNWFIRRQDFDCSDNENLVHIQSGFVLGIALDLAGGKIYWADVGHAKVQRSNLNGSNVEDLVVFDDFRKPVAIAVPGWREDLLDHLGAE